MDESDNARLERLSFYRGLEEAVAVHTTPAGQDSTFSEDIAPRVGFRMHRDDQGRPMLSMVLDFSDCAVATRLSQPTMMLAIHDLSRESLEFLDIFVAVKKRELGINTRYVADSDDGPPDNE